MHWNFDSIFRSTWINMLSYWCRRLGCSFLPLAGPGLVWGLLMWSIAAERGICEQKLHAGGIALIDAHSMWAYPHGRMDTWQRKHGSLFGSTAGWGAIFRLFSPYYSPLSLLENDIVFRRATEGCYWVLMCHCLVLWPIVEKATNPRNRYEDWEFIMAFCDQVNAQPEGWVSWGMEVLAVNNGFQCSHNIRGNHSH